MISENLETHHIQEILYMDSNNVTNKSLLSSHFVNKRRLLADWTEKGKRLNKQKEKKRDLRMKEERSKRKQKEFRKNTTIDEELSIIICNSLQPIIMRRMDVFCQNYHQNIIFSKYFLLFTLNQEKRRLIFSCHWLVSINVCLKCYEPLV